MMNKKSVDIIIFFLCLLFTYLNVVGKVPEDMKKIYISSEEEVVKGFPVIIKVTAYGPQSVPRIELFDELAEISVTLTEKESKKKYMIESSRQRELIITTRDGDRRDQPKDLFRVNVPAGETRTMLLDISSLRPETGKGTIMADVPPGIYSVSVFFPSSGHHSNAINIKILPPRKKEQLFLDKVLELSVLKIGGGIKWNKLLRDGVKIPKTGFIDLPQKTKQQMGFHFLLSEVISSKTMIKAIDIKPLESIVVPNYLKPEKEWLFIEMKLVSEEKVSKEIEDKILNKNPGILWRVREMKKYRRNFLLYKSMQKEKVGN